ncbi:hypothetical protein N431DRAFT_411812 [Stipitochalara longipes BDJ]|nr:hypothetical protein N431DRAFT_411812 [Stipitochalara longipes BDJ]
MYSFLLIYILITVLQRRASACMHYSATFPYATNLPFEATLTDDGVVTCWISMTYDKHNEQQTALSNHRRMQQRIARHVTEDPISLTKEPEKSLVRLDAGLELEGGGDDDVKNIWLPWEFKCLDGYQAHAGIGLRAVWYSAHGQEFEFVPGCEEDVLNDMWVYDLDLWCSA